jgi:hypothetical protein
MMINKNNDLTIIGFSYKIKLFVVLVPIIIFFIGGVSNNNVFSQSNDSNAATTTPLNGLQTEQFSQIVITSAQIDELNSTINNAIQATNQDNLTQVVLELKILQNQLDLLNNP